MADFLEERISDLIRYGSTWTEEFAVDASESANGDSFRSLIHPYPKRIFDASYMLDDARLWSELVNVYMRAHGTFAGFRARCFDEWSTNGARGTPTAFDQPLLAVTAGATYQLRKLYGTDKAAGASGYAYRLIRKPVAGTTKFGIGGKEIRSADWSVDATTGIITCAADHTYAVTGITQASQAVLTIGSHSCQLGESFCVTGAGGMTQINGLRGNVVAKAALTITLDINSSAFSAYTSGGAVHRRPQTGETVTAGCEFDFPIRFITALPVGMDYPGWRPVESLKFEELLNP